MGKLLVLRPPEMAKEPKQDLPNHSAVARELVSRAARVLCPLYSAYGGGRVQAFDVDQETFHPWPAGAGIQDNADLLNTVPWPYSTGPWGGA
jgi:hypothetical protein